MNKRVYVAIESEYDRRRKEAHDLAIKKRDEIFEKIPELGEIEERIQNAGITHSLLIVTGGEDTGKAEEELGKEIEKLKRKKTEILGQNGFPVNYLEPVYKCSKCNDTGFDGSERCSCFRQQLIKQLYRESNMFRLDSENWETFNEEYYSGEADERKYGIKVSPRENILRIKERCMDFIEKFSNTNQKNLFFSGPTGTGKTFMASCIAGALLDKGHTVLYQSAPSLFNKIGEYKAKAYKEGDFSDEAYSSIFTANLLIIDDLGTETTTAARYAEILNILNTREMNNTRKPCKTLISTNLGPRKLYEHYTERVGSRIIGNFERLVFAGDDIRAIKATE